MVKYEITGVKGEPTASNAAKRSSRVRITNIHWIMTAILILCWWGATKAAVAGIMNVSLP